jgi:hypothetical protein
MRVSSDRPIESRGGGWLHNLGSRSVAWAAGKANARPKVTPLPPEVLSTMNNRILELLPALTPADAQLIGLINPDRCASYMRNVKTSVATQVAYEFGQDYADRHPALINARYDEGESQWSYDLAAYYNGVVIPFDNERTGHTLGLQLRNSEDKKKRVITWLSHDGRGGSPFGVKYAPGHRLAIISEGRKKAEALDLMFSCNVIYLAGVASYDKATLLAELDALGGTDVAIAFDRDKVTNQAVRNAHSNLLKLIQTERPGLKVSTLEWPDDQGKGFDDAYLAGFRDFEFKPAPTPKQKRIVTGLPLELLTTRFGSQLRELLNLDQAHRVLSGFFSEILTTAGKERRQVILDVPTGAGKSRAADDTLTDKTLSGELKIERERTLKGGRSEKYMDDARVLVVCADKANVLERTAPDTKIHALFENGIARRQLGRQWAPGIGDEDKEAAHTPTEYDCRNHGQASAAGQARHIPAKAICGSCPFGSLENWQRAFGDDTPMPWECQIDGYLHSRELSKAAQVVYATKEAYLNDSAELDSFDIIIIDEALLPLLIDRIVINKEVIAGWRERFSIYERSVIKNYRQNTGSRNNKKNWKVGPNASGAAQAPATVAREKKDWTLLFNILSQFLDGLNDTHAGETNPVALHPVMAGITETAARLNINLFDTWLSGLPQPAGADADAQIYPFEKPYDDNNTGPGPGRRLLRFPIRAAYDLVEALKIGDMAIKAQRTQEGSFSLVIHRTKDKLIDRLRSKTIAILDATPPPHLFKLLPELEIKTFNVAQHLNVIQTTNAMYTKHDLADARTRETVQQAITAYLKGANPEKCLVIMPKRYREGEITIAVPAEVQVGHWGKDDRATNQYQNYERVVLIGHPERPLDYIQAEVEAIRVYTGEVAPAPAPVPASVKGDSLRLYNYSSPDGQVTGRHCNAHFDPDIQAAIQHDYIAFITQAAGRLRGVLRSPDQPAQVLIMCAEPVGSFKIDQLTTTAKIIAGEVKLPATEHGPQIAQVDRVSAVTARYLSREKAQPVPERFPLYIYGETARISVVLSDPVATTVKDALPPPRPAPEPPADISPPKYTVLMLAMDAAASRADLEEVHRQASACLIPLQMNNFNLEYRYLAARKFGYISTPTKYGAATAIMDGS